MKNISILFILFFLLVKTNAQELHRLDELGNPVKEKVSNNEAIPGEIIIKFKDNYINKAVLESSASKFNSVQAKKTNTSVKKEQSFFSNFTNNKMRKVVTKYKPSYGKSTSRLGVASKKFDFQNLMVLEVDTSNDLKSLCKQIETYEEVEYAEPNYLLSTHDSPPNDTRYAFQDGFEQATDRDIDANRAWDFTTGNEAIKVAVIDNGVDYHNIDLGNGAFNTANAKVRGGWDYANNDNNPDDTNIDNGNDSHGTPVAGIIGAFRNNGIGVAGLAGGDVDNPGAQIIALKVGNGRRISTSNAIDAIIEASSNTPNFGYGCHILNNSWGGGEYNESLRSAIRFAAQNNVVFVASKGNDNFGELNYPSDYDQSWVLSVGATDANDRRVNTVSWGSNFGNGIDVAAPGRFNIVETTATVEEGSWRGFNGTSAAAPHVSGLAALILSEAIEQGISLHHEDVENIIEVSSEDVNGGGYDDDLGHGRINAGRALEMMNTPWELTHHSIRGGTIVNSTGWYNAFLSNPGGGLSSAWYLVKRHEVQTTVNLPFYTDEAFVWGRGTNASTGWSAANPNYQVGFTDVPSHTNTIATLRTFVYEVNSILGQNLGWTTRPENVVFAYTTLGTPCPDNLNIWQEINPGTQNEQIVFSAENDLTASNSITSGSNVLYRTGRQITLHPNFHAQNGSEFQTSLDGCNQIQMKARLTPNSSSNDSNISKTTTLANSSEETLLTNSDTDILIYPNPFKDFVTIAYSLSKDSNVEIKVFDSLGKEVATLIDNNLKKQGQHHVNFGSSSLNSGIFFYKIKTDEYTKSGRLIKQ